MDVEGETNMERTKRYLPLMMALALIGSSGTSYGSSGTEGAAFLDIPVGGGPASLGSAYTALAMDAYAPTWNPAGLALIDGKELAGQHLSYLESMNYEYISYVHPLSDGKDSPVRRGIGFSAQYLGSGDIPATDATGASLGDFTSHWGAYNFSYGQSLSDRLSVGLTGKWINAKIDDVSANAYGADFGAFYRISDKINAAFTAKNFGTKLKFLSEGDPLPMAFHAGASYEPTSHWTLASEAVYRKTGLASFHVGGAWRPLEAISLRAGYKTDTLEGLNALAGFTTGIGLHLWGQELAYAWAPYGELGNAQYFSLLARFGGRDKANRDLIHYQTIRKHRTVKSAEPVEPEYQQLMQLLNDSDAHMAQSSQGRGSMDQ